MNDMWVTVCGNVGTNPQITRTARGTKTTFRVAHTPRVRQDADWQDGETSWYTVVAWNALGENAYHSLVKGQRVLVHGRHRIDEWTDEQGAARTTAEITADALGHDLRFGITSFGRPQWQRPDVALVDGAAVPAQPGAAGASGSGWETPVPAEGFPDAAAWDVAEEDELAATG